MIPPPLEGGGRGRGRAHAMRTSKTVSCSVAPPTLTLPLKGGGNGSSMGEFVSSSSSLHVLSRVISFAARRSRAIRECAVRSSRTDARGGSASRDRDDPLLPRGTTGSRRNAPRPARRASKRTESDYRGPGWHPFRPRGLGCRVTTLRNLSAARRSAREPDDRGLTMISITSGDRLGMTRLGRAATVDRRSG